MNEKPSGSFFSNLKAETENYIHARVRLFQLDITEKISRLSGIIAVVILLSVIFMLLMLGLSLMAGYYFAHKMQSYYYGFAVVAGFYLFLAIIIWLGRKKLATFIADKMVHTIFNATTGNVDTED